MYIPGVIVMLNLLYHYSEVICGTGTVPLHCARGQGVSEQTTVPRPSGRGVFLCARGRRAGPMTIPMWQNSSTTLSCYRL